MNNFLRGMKAKLTQIVHGLSISEENRNDLHGRNDKLPAKSHRQKEVKVEQKCSTDSKSKPTKPEENSMHERRLGCNQLGREAVIGGRTLQTCCPKSPKNPEYFHIAYDKSNIKEGLERYKERVATLLDQHRRGIAGPCEGCGNLIHASFPVKHKRKFFLFAQGFKGDFCNLRCSYCDTHDVLASNPSFDVELKEMVAYLLNTYKGEALTFRFANGEFLARGKDADDILALFTDQDVRIAFTTNATVYRESVERLIRLGKVAGITVSLDSGTKETYEKIKGRDLFDKVACNLKKYTNKGVPIDLKYIVIPELNDNQVDGDGFIDAANDIRPALVVISGDMHKRHNRLPEQTIAFMVKLYRMAVSRGHKVQIQYECLNEHDSSLIRAEVKGV